MLEDIKITRSATERYIAENEYVMSLPVMVVAAQPKKFHADSIFYLLLRKLISLKGLKGYFIEITTCWHWLIRMWSLKNSQNLNEVMVIGNGPSQGYLNIQMLSEFKKKGGQLFVVNHWTENKNLSEIIPNYIVISDPGSLSVNNFDPIMRSKNERLLTYLMKNNSIKIACPVRRCKELSKIFGKNRVTGFIDSELSMWTQNLSPIFPRGYLSMTLYKALALSIWFGYKKIYIIGMDNTYPRNIYCNIENKIFNHEMHAGCADFVVDMSGFYDNVGDALMELAKLFHDAKKFTKKNIINLDQYSLTDAFLKISINDWSDEINKKKALN